MLINSPLGQVILTTIQPSTYRPQKMLRSQNSLLVSMKQALESYSNGTDSLLLIVWSLKLRKHKEEASIRRIRISTWKATLFFHCSVFPKMPMSRHILDSSKDKVDLITVGYILFSHCCCTNSWHHRKGNNHSPMKNYLASDSFL